jgi:predicted MFS family arabinose efflux permease
LRLTGVPGELVVTGCNPAAVLEAAEHGLDPPAVLIAALIVLDPALAGRGRALGILSLGGPIGSLCGMLFGGLVAGLWGWRVAFLAAGLPGLILTVIVLRVVKDMRANVALSVPSLTFPEAFGAIARKRCFWLVCLGGAGYGFIALGTSAFVTSFFLRNHAAGLADIATPLGLSPIGFLGAALGILGGVGGMAGSLAGGTLGDRLSAGSPKGHVTLCAVSVLLLLPFHLLTMAIPDIRVALALWFMVVFQFFYIGPMWATIQNLSPPGTRAIAGAIHLLCGNLIGLGLGPLFVGVASDHYQGAFGVDAAAGLKYALITLELAAVPTVFFFASCRRWIAEALYQPDT